MSVSTDQFIVDSLPFETVDNGTSILLTGDDTEALKSVFTRLVAPDDGEHGIVLATDSGGRSIQRLLDDVRHGAGSRTSVLTSAGAGHGENFRSVEDLGNLTSLGMEFSDLVATAQQSADRFRSGIFLCSTICQEVDDTRSIYRFLNTNFMTELRRGNGIGVCALDLGADLDVDVDSMVAGMKTSFSAHLDIEKTGLREATLTAEGLSGVDETTEVSL
jgi:hypothetical protein